MSTIYTDENGVIQSNLPPPKRKAGRPRKRVQVVWDEATQSWQGPRPANAKHFQTASLPAEDVEDDPETLEEKDARRREALKKSRDDYDAQQLRRFGCIYHYGEDGKLLPGSEAITMSEEYSEMLTTSLENGDLIPQEDGFFVLEDGTRMGWKSPSPHDKRVRDCDWESK